MLYNQNILWPKKKSVFSFDFLDELFSLDCFSIVKSKSHLSVLGNPRLQKWIKFENFIIFGTGGSSLGGQCIHALSDCGGKNVKFVNNLDPNTLQNLFSKINIKETGFLCISKSGETLETICQTLLAIELTKNLDNIKDRFVFITEDKISSMKEIATKFNFLCLDHPKTIGGRFSVFSMVGMLPAVLCGIDPTAIISGGRRVLENFGNSIYKVKEGASFVVQSFHEKFTQHVSFIYSDKLFHFGEWLAQLYAESTGKCGIGITPITAKGSVDQHSQLQLYLDGSHDKCFSFFTEKQTNELSMNSKYFPEKFAYLKNKKVFDIFEAQSEATFTSILEKGFNVRKIEIPPLTPEILGALFMHFMLETACVCKLIEVNPFNQPAVERGKILTKELLDTK